MKLFSTLLLALLVSACSSTPPTPPADSGQPVSDAGGQLDCDAGCDRVPDAGALDAGAPNDPHGGSADGGSCSGSPGDHLRTQYFGGALRVWYEHVPANYDCTQASPVVFDFHGYSSNAVEEIALTGLNAKADVANFIAVHPEGLGAVQSWNAGACCGDAALSNSDDVAMVRAMLANVAQRYNVDARRVYAMGMSNGGFFSHRLACEASDVFAAIAPVAGVMGVPTCSPSRPVPVLDFHGTSDPVVPYGGGGLTGFTSVDATMAGWVQRDGCGATSSVVYQQGDATCRTWPGCSGGAEVQLCTIDNGGHTWPGGLPIPALGKTSTDVNATDRAWDFFVAHPLP